MDPFLVRPPLATELVAIPGDGSTVSVPLRDGLVVGRGEACDLVIDAPDVPTRHIYFDVELARIRIRAFDERRGFAIRTAYDQRAIEAVLRLGDVVVVGEVPILMAHRLAPPPWYADARALLDRIREEPDDDEPRLVLADWLAERDPVRSEFISCQIAAARGSAAAASRAEQLACLELAAPLAVPVTEWTFGRGFLASARVIAPTTTAPLLHDHPGCAITTLTFPARPHLR